MRLYEGVAVTASLMTKSAAAVGPPNVATPPVCVNLPKLNVAGWRTVNLPFGVIMTATSDDGLVFTKEETPCIGPDGDLDATFASDPCVFQTRDGRWRMIYEAADAAGITRLLSAVPVEC